MMKDKRDLKDVFKGISSVMYQKSPIFSEGDKTSISLAPEFDLPVKLDTLTINEGDPSVNHYKVFGLDTDWVSTSTKGDTEIKFLVPTKHTDVMKLAYGDSAVKTYTATIGTDSFSGDGVRMSKNEVRGTIALLNEAKDQLCILSNVTLWASLKYENASTEPYAVQFSGTIEASAGADILFLKKTKK